MQQISLEVPDRPGELAFVVGLMGKARIDIKALYLARNSANQATGAVKMIVTDSRAAMQALEGAGYHPVAEDVVVVAIEDQPGGLAAVLDILAASKVNILYAYSFVSRLAGKALSVLGPDDAARATRILRQAGVTIIDGAPLPNGKAHVPNEPDLSAYVGGVFYW